MPAARHYHQLDERARKGVRIKVNMDVMDFFSSLLDVIALKVDHTRIANVSAAFAKREGLLVSAIEANRRRGARLG